jgi:isochorismate synthase EntC
VSGGPEKDRREHAFVVAEVVEVVRRYCVDLTVPERP